MKRLGWVLVGLALVFAVLVAGRLVPTDNEQVAQIPTSGEVGEPVDTGGFTLTVQEVRVTSTLTAESSFGGQGAQRTDYIWLVVKATIVGDWRPTVYDDARIETGGGYLYRASERMPSGVLNDEQIQPGIARVGMIPFELPKDRLVGAKLRLGRSLSEDVRLGPEAVIDLGIDAAEADRLLKAAPKQIRLPKVVYG